MKPTRQTQPYRRSGSRAPGLVLEKMLAGRATPAPSRGRTLAKAMGRPPRGKLMVPRY